MNLDEARRMAEAATQSGKTNHTAFTFRYRPCVRQARAMMAAGLIGEVRHFSARFYHSSYNDPARPISWRLKHNQSGGGALADLGIHLIDTLHLLLGDFSWIQCETRTFITERPSSAGSAKMESVDVDDWALCALGLRNGSAGSMEVSRVASGNPNLMQIEIIGSKGTLRVDFAHDDTTEYFNSDDGLWKSGTHAIAELENETPLKEIYPPSKHSLGSHFNSHLASAYDFIRRAQKNSQRRFQSSRPRAKRWKPLTSPPLNKGRGFHFLYPDKTNGNSGVKSSLYNSLKNKKRKTKLFSSQA